MEEINDFYNFGEDASGESDNDEDSDRDHSDDEQGLGEENYDGMHRELEVDLELDEQHELRLEDSELDFVMEVRHPSFVGCRSLLTLTFDMRQSQSHLGLAHSATKTDLCSNVVLKC